MDEKQLKELQDALVNKIDEKVSALDERIKKIESVPAEKKNFSIGTPQKYKGHKVSTLLSHNGLRDKCMKDGTLEVLNKEENIEAFGKYMLDCLDYRKTGNSDTLKSMHEFISKATMQEGTTTTGGYLVPDEYMFDVIKLTRDRFFALNECTVVNMGTDVLRVPTETGLVSVAWTAEGSNITQSEPTVGELVLTNKRLDCFGELSNELLADSAIDIAGWLTEQISYAVNRELDNQVLNGTGSPVSGITTAAAGFSVVTSGTNPSSITGVDLSNMIQKIDQGFNENGKFIFNKNVVHLIRTLQDSQNAFLYSPIGGVQSRTIWGYPLIESTKASSAVTTATAFGVFGNMKYFYIGRRAGSVALEFDPYGLFVSNETRFRVVTRWALGVAQANAFCRIVTA